MRINSFVIFLVASMFVANIVHADLISDSAALDRAYIPALAHTSVGQADASRLAMVRLHQAWAVYKKAHYHDFPDDEAWKQGFHKIAQWITKADGLLGGVETEIDTHEAHEALEHIRVILMHLRQKHGIDYFLDHQTAFHEPMEQIVLSAKGKTPLTFGTAELTQIRTALPELESRWNSVRTASFVGTEYGIDAAGMSRIRQFIQQESAAIETLKQALDSGDENRIIQAAVAIKPPFARLFKSFGEF